jgi:hypothetical protein
MNLTKFVLIAMTACFGVVAQEEALVNTAPLASEEMTISTEDCITRNDCRENCRERRCSRGDCGDRGCRTNCREKSCRTNSCEKGCRPKCPEKCNESNCVKGRRSAAQRAMGE